MMHISPQHDDSVELQRIDLASALVGTDFNATGAARFDRTAVLAGHYRLEKLRSGIILHATDASAAQDMTTRIIQQPGVTISLFLKGRINAWVDGAPLVDDENSEGDPAIRPRAFMITRAKPVLFERYGHRGEHIRKVNVTLPAAWLTGPGLATVRDALLVRRFAEAHLSRIVWEPSPAMVAIAEEILAPAPRNPFLASLHLESRALEFVACAFSRLAANSILPATSSVQDRKRMRSVEEVLHSGRPVSSLAELAREAGVSVSTLQRLTRHFHGTSASEYLRSRRLHEAWECLKGGMTVAEAAYRAGYSTPANFATAFRLQFGRTPTSVRMLREAT
jgi:AraC-like DNA-binding protein